MEKLTYKQFEKEINSIGYSVELDDGWVYVEYDYNNSIAAVDKKVYKNLDLDWKHYKSLTNEEKELVADLCWQLASTPLADREEQKKYYLKVKPRYNHLFSFGEIYLNYQRQNANIFMSDYHENLHWQTQFTEEECEKLGKEYDLTILERVEVDDEELD